METYTKRLEELNLAVTNMLAVLIASPIAVQSKHTSDKCLEVRNDDLMFNLDGGRYLTELHYDKIVDNNGYQYSYDCLTMEQKCELVDYFLTNQDKSYYHDWQCTDPSCNQYRRDINENTFEFREDRIINPETGETIEYRSEICLSDYTQEEMFEDVQPFGYSFNEMCDWIDEGKNLDLIAECIFEMEEDCSVNF